MNIISAKEAREKTEIIVNKNGEEELLNIMLKINKAIDKGEYSIFNDGYLSSEVEKKLKKLGYKIKINFDTINGQPYYKISWLKGE